MTPLWPEFEIHDDDSAATVQRIVSAAQHEILTKGIFGFRTLNVAQRANCNISMIYRYFDSRDHLIVRVLGELFRTLQHQYVDSVTERLNDVDVVTPEYLVGLVPNLDDIEHSKNARIWLLAVTLSAESDELRNSLLDTFRELMPKWSAFFEMVNRKLEPSVSLDYRVYQMILRMNFLYYNSLFGEMRVSDASYKSYLAELLHRSPSPAIAIGNGG